jgi:hypothetical protein
VFRTEVIGLKASHRKENSHGACVKEPEMGQRYQIRKEHCWGTVFKAKQLSECFE